MCLQCWVSIIRIKHVGEMMPIRLEKEVSIIARALLGEDVVGNDVIWARKF